MKVIFYSNKCDISNKILNYLDTLNIKLLFKLINIDDNNIDYSSVLKIDNKELPIMIDSELNQPVKGNDVYNYLINIKYFNIATNNIDNVIPDNPLINNTNDNKTSIYNNNLYIKDETPNNIDYEQLNKLSIKNKKIKYYLLKK